MKRIRKTKGGFLYLRVMSKVFTSILNKRLYRWAEEEQKIREKQAGVQEKYSTVGHIFTLVSIIRKCLFGPRKLYVAFIDYLKAFDSVDRQSLWGVLKKSKPHQNCCECYRVYILPYSHV